MKTPFPRVALHPQTLKHMKLGHPWVTEDSFTRKFPHSPFLVGMSADKKAAALLLHDEQHKKIKARLWSLSAPFDISEEEFKAEFHLRLKTAFSKRKGLIQENSRENFYLVFGESDFLPGIFLQRLKNHFVLGLYTQFWDHYLTSFIAPLILQELKILFPTMEI
jgi:23S rRNA (cytosine1962-C5)-methyltransferase